MDKLYYCPKCESLSTSLEWDKATESYFGRFIIRMDDNSAEGALFCCPKCMELNYYINMICVSPRKSN